MSTDNEIKSLYYGSTEYLTELKSKIDEILEHRKAFKYELFFRVYYESGETTPIIVNAHYFKDLVELKQSPKKFMTYNQPCHEYKVFLRELSSNYTIMLGKKNKACLLELTENFFKLV